MPRYQLTRRADGGSLGPRDETCVVEIAEGDAVPEGAEPLPDTALLLPWRTVPLAAPDPGQHDTDPPAVMPSQGLFGSLL